MIKVLSKNIAAKIAAGEVIERPLSIVKELVENAIDAEATSITCEIKNGGKSYLRVTDNGIGIPDGETEIAFLRHATSKIDTAKDLDAIESLGFRGEALSSIAAVTRTSLVTKTKDSKLGSRVTIHGGEVIEHTQVGCPDGTTMVVLDLFYNTPARREFLKSDHAESGVIIEFLSEMAIAYPSIRFQLINNGKILFTSRGDGNRMHAITAVYKQREYRDLVEVEYQADGYHLSGCISRPSLTRTTRRDQIFFVNGRSVGSKVMEKGVTKGYQERLFEGRFPVVFLFLTVDPATIDVNIHPNKKEVRFHDEQAIVRHMQLAIQQALASEEAVIEASDTVTYRPPEEIPVPPSVARETSINKDETAQVDIKNILSNMRERVQETFVPANDEPTLTEEIASLEHEEAPAVIPSESEEPVVTRPQITIEAPRHAPFDIQNLTVTGNIFRTYITATDEKAFYLIDQHAAQERIFYEKLVGEYLSDDKPSQTIMMPILLDVSLSVKENEYSWLGSLRDMGYGIDEFGPNTYRITEIPYFMELSEAEDFAKDFVDQIRERDDLSNTVVINKLITTSCKRSVKAHDKLSEMEMKDLLSDLCKCRNPFSCPHGRPTIIRFSEYEIEKMFKRVQ